MTVARRCRPWRQGRNPEQHNTPAYNDRDHQRLIADRKQREERRSHDGDGDGDASTDDPRRDPRQSTIDTDGDLDIVIGEEGDGGNLPNRIFINQGDLKGGSLGAFNDESATRFAGIPNDMPPDLDFADIDADGDLNIIEANRGNNTVGAVSRFYVNQDGIQLGSLGSFIEGPADAWGTLISVKPANQIFGGDEVPSVTGRATAISLISMPTATSSSRPTHRTSTDRTTRASSATMPRAPSRTLPIGRCRRRHARAHARCRTR